MRLGSRVGSSGLVICLVFLAGCGSTATTNRSREPEPGYLAESVIGNDGVLKVCSPQTGRERRRIRGFSVIPIRTRPALTLTANGDALSPDGRTAYVVSIGHGGMKVAQVSTSTGRASIIARGAQPSISPNGRLLAFGSGSTGKVLTVRNVATGRTRSIDLARWIGHGNLEPGGVGNGSMTWLSNNTDVAVIPDESVFWDLVGKRPDPPNNPCSDKQSVTSCVLVVHTGSRPSQPLAVTLHRLPAGIENVRTLGADHTDPSSLLAVGFPLVLKRIHLHGRLATVKALVTIRGNALADAFNPDGTKLLYQSSQPSRVRELTLPGDSSSAPQQTTLGKSCGTPVAW